MDRKVGAYAAKTRLPELLREAEQGSRVTITVRGRAVAELGPAPQSRGSVAEAVAAMRDFEPVRGVDPEDLRAWIEDGRR